MRCVFVLCIALSASPAVAESDSVPNDIKVAIEATEMIVGADKVCPRYRANLVRTKDLMDRYGLNIDDINDGGKYSDFATQTVDGYKKQIAQDKDSFCNLAWDIFGDTGKIPHLLVLR